MRGPLIAIRQVVAAKRVQVCWESARVVVLAPRPLQCFQCLGMGHVRANCRGHTDRSGRCSRYTDSGLKALDCGAATPKVSGVQ